MTKFLQELRVTSMHNECAFVGGPMAPPNKSKMAVAAIFNFGKMPITLDQIKISAPNSMGRCIATTRRWPRDQNLKPEVNSRDVIKWKSEA